MVNDKVESGESVVAILKTPGQPDKVVQDSPVDGDECPFDIVVTIRDRRTNKMYQYEVKAE